MKSIRRILAFLAFASALTVHSATVFFDISDFTSGPAVGRKVVVSPTGATTLGPLIVHGDPKVYVTDSAGQFYISNAVSGVYNVEILAPPRRTSFSLTIIPTNGLINASDYVTVTTNQAPGGQAYSMASSDGRFVQRTEPWAISAGTNIITVTNGAVVQINSTASGEVGGVSTTYPIILYQNGTNYGFTDLSVAWSNVLSDSMLVIGPGTYPVQSRCATSLVHNVQMDLLGALVLQGVSNVVIQGLGRTVIYSTNYGNFLVLGGTTNVTIRGIELRSNRPDMPTNILAANGMIHSCGIQLTRTNFDILIEDCRFIQLPNQGISGNVIAKNQRNVTIRGNYFQEVGCTNDIPSASAFRSTWNDGAAVSGIGSGWRIENNYLWSCNRGIELDSGSSGDPTTAISNIVVSGNMIFQSEGEAIFTSSQPYTGIVISENTIVETVARRTNSVAAPIQIAGGTNIVIRGNTIRGSYYFWGQNKTCNGIEIGNGLVSVSDVLVTGNSISDLGHNASQSLSSGIAIFSFSGMTVKNVMVSGNKIFGLDKYYSRGIAVYPKNAGGDDISDIQIMGNTIEDVLNMDVLSYAAIALVSGSNIVVSGNEAHGTLYPTNSNKMNYGLWIGPDVVNVMIGDNNFSGCRYGGITNNAATGNYTFTGSNTNQTFWGGGAGTGDRNWGSGGGSYWPTGTLQGASAALTNLSGWTDTNTIAVRGGTNVFSGSNTFSGNIGLYGELVTHNNITGDGTLILGGIVSKWGGQFDGSGAGVTNLNLTEATNYINLTASNRVLVAKGTGGITVVTSTPAANMTLYTISDDDAGGSFSVADNHYWTGSNNFAGSVTLAMMTMATAFITNAYFTFTNQYAFAGPDGKFYGTNIPAGTGTGSSNITDTAYIARARNVTVETNLIVEGTAGTGNITMDGTITVTGTAGTGLLTVDGKVATSWAGAHYGNGVGLTNVNGWVNTNTIAIRNGTNVFSGSNTFSGNIGLYGELIMHNNITGDGSIILSGNTIANGWGGQFDGNAAGLTNLNLLLATNYAALVGANATNHVLLATNNLNTARVTALNSASNSLSQAYSNTVDYASNVVWLKANGVTNTALIATAAGVASASNSLSASYSNTVNYASNIVWLYAQSTTNALVMTNGAQSLWSKRILYSTNLSVNGDTLDMSRTIQITNAAGAITYAGISGIDPSSFNQTVVTINANGADRAITFPTSWENPDDVTVFYVTNGWKALMTVAVYGVNNTSVVWRLIK